LPPETWCPFNSRSCADFVRAALIRSGRNVSRRGHLFRPRFPCRVQFLISISIFFTDRAGHDRREAGILESRPDVSSRSPPSWRLRSSGSGASPWPRPRPCSQPAHYPHLSKRLRRPRLSSPALGSWSFVPCVVAIGPKPIRGTSRRGSEDTDVSVSIMQPLLKRRPPVRQQSGCDARRGASGRLRVEAQAGRMTRQRRRRGRPHSQ